MELAFFIYLVDTICKSENSNIIMVPWIMIFVSLAGLAFSEVAKAEDGYKDALSLAIERTNFKKPLIFSCIILVLMSLIPTQKTAYTMLGAYGIQTFATAVYENDQAKRIAEKSLGLVEAAISKYEKDLTEGK